MHRTLCTARARFRSVLVACTARAQSSMRNKWIKNMFRESAKYVLNFKNISSEFWERFWKKYFFHPRVPPLVFSHSVRTDLVEVGGKFEASFHSISYFCELRSHLDSKNTTQLFCIQDPYLKLYHLLLMTFNIIVSLLYIVNMFNNFKVVDHNARYA